MAFSWTADRDYVLDQVCFSGNGILSMDPELDFNTFPTSEDPISGILGLLQGGGPTQVQVISAKIGKGEQIFLSCTAGTQLVLYLSLADFSADSVP
jgi:hypothetical protein